jgi:outer membrane protein TolC
MSAVRLVLAATLLVGGCSSLRIDGNLQTAGGLAREATPVAPRLLWNEEQRRDAARELDGLLQQALQMDDAVRIAVAHSPAFQAMLFEAASSSAGATQSSRLPNPVFTFERLVRREHGEVEKDIGRMLAVSVFDILLLPSRLEASEYRQQQLQLRMAGDIVQAASAARQAWVNAVAAQQAAVYAEQVQAAAEASAELARRMQAVGNFSKLQRAREQAFYAEATAQLARARQNARSAREMLVRTLALDDAAAGKLILPDRLPDLPPAPRDESATTRVAMDERLDVRMARAELEYLARQLGPARAAGFVDGLHLAAVRNSETGRPSQKGFEVEVPLPLFDFGDARRAQSQTAYMAALYRAAAASGAAASHVRETYGSYRDAYDIARHYRDEVVPLRKAIAEEMLLKYNGMLIGVFELLADSREQAGSVIQAIAAQRDFWLADAALNATIIGKPLSAPVMDMKPAGASAAAGH